jgi:hypothetical protein
VQGFVGTMDSGERIDGKRAVLSDGDGWPSG